MKCVILKDLFGAQGLRLVENVACIEGSANVEKGESGDLNCSVAHLHLNAPNHLRLVIDHRCDGIILCRSCRKPGGGGAGQLQLLVTSRAQLNGCARGHFRRSWRRSLIALCEDLSREVVPLACRGLERAIRLDIAQANEVSRRIENRHLTVGDSVPEGVNKGSVDGCRRGGQHGVDRHGT